MWRILNWRRWDVNEEEEHDPKIENEEDKDTILEANASVSIVKKKIQED